jgi:hypothetical protein
VGGCVCEFEFRGCDAFCCGWDEWDCELDCYGDGFSDELEDFFCTVCFCDGVGGGVGFGLSRSLDRSLFLNPINKVIAQLNK